MKQIRLNFSDLKTGDEKRAAMKEILDFLQENEGTVYLEATIVKESDHG